MESVNGQVGTKIKMHRNRVGLTQESLALSAGINVSFLGDIERGKKKPSIESLEKLLKALNITFREFFDFEADITPFKNCTSLEQLNIELQRCSEPEVDMVYNIVKQILDFNRKE